jgi:hypothetical protein
MAIEGYAEVLPTRDPYFPQQARGLPSHSDWSFVSTVAMVSNTPSFLINL